MKLKFTIEYEAEVNLDMYTEEVTTIKQIILAELNNFDYKYAMQVISNDEFKLKISEIKDEEAF